MVIWNWFNLYQRHNKQYWGICSIQIEFEKVDASGNSIVWPWESFGLTDLIRNSSEAWFLLKISFNWRSINYTKTPKSLEFHSKVSPILIHPLSSITSSCAWSIYTCLKAPLKKSPHKIETEKENFHTDIYHSTPTFHKPPGKNTYLNVKGQRKRN